jgi:hypothetical protein
MTDKIEEKDFWWFRELYHVIVGFADLPEATVSRLREINVPEDYANHLHNFRQNILEKYPDAKDFEIMKVAADIDAILTEKSRDGKRFEERFWTNRAFKMHPEWEKIREISRAFMLR